MLQENLTFDIRYFSGSLLVAGIRGHNIYCIFPFGQIFLAGKKCCLFSPDSIFFPPLAVLFIFASFSRTREAFRGTKIFYFCQILVRFRYLKLITVCLKRTTPFALPAKSLPLKKPQKMKESKKYTVPKKKIY
jgi:hypothetical protein